MNVTNEDLDMYSWPNLLIHLVLGGLGGGDGVPYFEILTHIENLTLYNWARDNVHALLWDTFMWVWLMSPNHLTNLVAIQP